MNSQANNWSAYWRQDGAGGEVFVGPEGKVNAEIAAFWRSLFAGVDTGARIIDIACGAGSIFGHVGEPDNYELVAADLSVDALQLLRTRTPGAAAVVASASALPFRQNSFDLVVSQFGVEYAGPEAFEHAFHLLKPGGQIVTLSHIRDGLIDRKNATLQAGVRKAEDIDFIALAVRLTRAAFSGAGVEEAVRQFQPAEKAMAAFVAEHPGGLHGHLYAGFRQLIERRARYDEKDILDWLNGMTSELDLHRLRLHEMRKAALDDTAIEKVRTAANCCGVSLTIGQMTLAGQTSPVAWRIEGLKR
jgi:SAM-dependent methyltransferase